MYGKSLLYYSLPEIIWKFVNFYKYCAVIWSTLATWSNMKIDTYDYVPNKDSNNEGFIVR